MMSDWIRIPMESGYYWKCGPPHWKPEPVQLCQGVGGLFFMLGGMDFFTTEFPGAYWLWLEELDPPTVVNR